MHNVKEGLWSSQHILIFLTNLVYQKALYAEPLIYSSHHLKLII